MKGAFLVSRSVRQLLETFLNNMPSGVASIRRGVDDSQNEYLEVCPRNPRSARIRVLNEVGTEYVLAVGSGTVLEIGLEPTETDGLSYGSAEENFLAVCRAVSEGKLVERVSAIFGKNLFVYGRIILSGRALRSFSGLPVVPCWKTLRYEPYGGKLDDSNHAQPATN